MKGNLGVNSPHTTFPNFSSNLGVYLYLKILNNEVSALGQTEQAMAGLHGFIPKLNSKEGC
jgi:hypothetical protein